MHIASRALAAGAQLPPALAERDGARSTKPVVAVCAVRTGSGKSQTTRHVAAILRDAGQGRRPPPPDALRRPDQAGRPALRALRGSRCGRLHHRGARGVRAAPERGQPRLRRDRLRRDPGRGREGGRRDPLGRRQQRHAVHQARPAHRRRRSAPPRPRAPLSPGRDEPAHGRRLHRQQGRQRDARKGSTQCSTRSAIHNPRRARRARRFAVPHRGGRGRDRRQARARDRGRADADPWRDDLRRRRPRREGERRRRARRSSPVRGRLDRADLRASSRTSARSCRRWATGASRWRICARRSSAPTPISS